MRGSDNRENKAHINAGLIHGSAESVIGAVGAGFEANDFGQFVKSAACDLIGKNMCMCINDHEKNLLNSIYSIYKKVYII